MKSKRIAVLGGGFDHLLKIRGPLLRALAAAGHDVIAYTPGGHPEGLRELAAWGVKFRPLRLRNTSLNPARDALSFADLVLELRAAKADVLLAFSIKVVVYGLLAARAAGIPRRVAMITGLGYAFGDTPGLKRRLTRVAAGQAYRTALRAAHRVIFQNPDDLALFLDHGILDQRDRALLILGSGVDTDRFSFQPLPGAPPTVLMVARLLREKGVYEFADAARQVKRVRPEVRFVLAGGTYPSPTAVRSADLVAWTTEGIIDYRGEVADVRPVLAASHLFALPSYYREGIPMAALEALSTGRAVVTTTCPGCREIVEDGENGRLLPPRDARALATAILEQLKDPAQLAHRAKKSRGLCERKFAARKVIPETINALLT